MTFRGWCHSVEEYSKALEDAGLLIEIIREPKPLPEGILKRPSLPGGRGFRSSCT